MKKLTVNAQPESLDAVTDAIRSELKKLSVSSQELAKTLLLTEEIFVLLCANAAEGAKLSVRVFKSFGKKGVELRCTGKQVKLYSAPSLADEPEEGEDDMSEGRIRALLLTSYGDSLSDKYRKGENIVSILCGQPSQGSMKTMFIALALAVIAGLLLRLLPDAVRTAIDTYVLSPVKTLILNALKMVVAPLVFFSIANSVSSFTDLSTLGKLGSRLLAFYLGVGAVSIFISYGVSVLLDPGVFGSMSFIGTASTEAEASFDVVSFVTGLIPDTFFGPFSSSDMMQIIFLSVVSGIAAATMSGSDAIVSFLSSGCKLFSQVAALVSKGLPLMVFCSLCSLLAMVDLAVLRSLAELIFAYLLCVAGLVLLYCLIILLIVRKNPLTVLKKMFPAVLNAFALSSSSGAMPSAMDVCDRNLGIKSILYSFAIPMSLTINISLCCIQYPLATLFFAKLFGIVLTPSNLVALLLMSYLLSLGSAGVTGANYMVMSVLFARFGLPFEFMSLFIAVLSILDQLLSAANVLGNIIGTYVVAERSNFMQEAH